jgi:meso-butanediol dehydrogenase/(S,S)-butanediol dehydrogenase/diacetyl reductase
MVSRPPQSDALPAERRRIAITGAASGIGRATADLLVTDGCDVVLLDVAADDLDGTHAALRGRSAGSVEAEVLDVCDEHAIRATFGALAASGGLDGLVNCAGIVETGSIEGTSRESWDRTIAVNLTAPWLCAKHALPAFRARGGGSIVNVGSTASIVGLPSLAAYCASKGGVAQLTRAMALDLAPQNIRANCVCPGHIDTPLGDRFIASHDDPDVFRRAFAREHPIGRLGRPIEVASVIAFLLSAESGFMTGALIPVDGGYTAK